MALDDLSSAEKISKRIMGPGESLQPQRRIPEFSIGVLVTDLEQYRRLCESLNAHGFTPENAELLYIDNTQGNIADGYSGIREFLYRAVGEKLIVVHQDVVLVDDGYSRLSEKLAELDRIDPNWALAGNAGVAGLGGWALRITDPHIDNGKIGDLPARVDSLDENFIVIKRSSLVSPSADLSGFHFYGADLCLQAQLKGLSAYVIDFHVHHLGNGVKNEAYYQGLKRLEHKYSGIGRRRIIQTTCDIVFIGWPKWLGILRNPVARIIRLLGFHRGRGRNVRIPPSKTAKFK